MMMVTLAAGSIEEEKEKIFRRKPRCTEMPMSTMLEIVTVSVCVRLHKLRVSGGMLPQEVFLSEIASEAV